MNETEIPEINIFIDRVREIWKSGLRSILAARNKAAKEFGFKNFEVLREIAFKSSIWKHKQRDQR